jgi:hypothetical protein
MHYKNGRAVSIGDWVVGISHNSEHKPVCGIVVETMPLQGACNIKIHVWRDEHFTEGGEACCIPATESRGKIEYGDAKQFILASDGLRMVSAILGHGNWDGPYL